MALTKPGKSEMRVEESRKRVFLVVKNKAVAIDIEGQRGNRERGREQGIMIGKDRQVGT